jgi:uncharacterized protein (TIGR02246 family)
LTAFAGHKVVDKGGYLKDIPTALNSIGWEIGRTAFFAALDPYVFPTYAERSVSMKSRTLIALAGYVVLAGSASNAAQATRTQSCKVTTEQEIASLFDRWNQSLQTGDPHKVVANYAERSILLPTVSNKPRLTPAEKEDYFHHFLENRPSGKIDLRFVEIGCNTAVDAGLYTFTFAKTRAVVSGRYSYTYRWDGSKWLITSHHSSVMPEKK